MNIRFFKHGQGNTKLAAEYVVNDVDHTKSLRAGVEVICGDPKIFTALCEANPHKWKYTSGVIAFAPTDNPTEEQIYEVLDRFEETAFAGLEPEQYHLFATRHIEADGSTHIHILVPRLELNTGKSLNIAPPGHENYYAPLRDYFNYKYAWARPDDPLRAKTLKEPRFTKKEFLGHLNEYIQELVMHDVVHNQADVAQAIKEYPHVINVRPSKNYIAVDLKDGKTHRIKGAFYEAGFQLGTYYENRREQTNTSKPSRGTQDTTEYALERTREHEQRLTKLTQQRREYNQAYYSCPYKQPQHLRTDRSNSTQCQSELRTPKSTLNQPQPSRYTTEPIEQHPNQENRGLSPTPHPTNRPKTYQNREYDQETLSNRFFNQSVDHTTSSTGLYDLSNLSIQPNYRDTESHDWEQQNHARTNEEIKLENRAKYALDCATRNLDQSQRTTAQRHHDYHQNLLQCDQALREADEYLRRKESASTTAEPSLNSRNQRPPNLSRIFEKIGKYLTSTIDDFDQQFEYRRTGTTNTTELSSSRNQQPNTKTHPTIEPTLDLSRELSRKFGGFSPNTIFKALDKLELKREQKRQRNEIKPNKSYGFDF